MARKNVADIVRENKTAFIIIAVVLFLIELEIFAVAVMKSGKKSWLQVIDKSGNVIHETDGRSLSDFNKYYFEKTFGPFENYEVRLQREDQPFPFRAWFVAAIGIPLGIVLLFAFTVKAYVSLFYGDINRSPPEKGGKGAENGSGTDLGTDASSLEKVVAAVSGFNIFTIGFLLLIGVLAYWVIPNVVAYLGQVGIDTLGRYKWVFITAAAVGMGIFIWIIYLRFLLAKKAIDNQTEMSKYRIKLEYQYKQQLALEHRADPDAEPRPMVAWRPDDEVIDAEGELEEPAKP